MVTTGAIHQHDLLLEFLCLDLFAERSTNLLRAQRAAAGHAETDLHEVRLLAGAQVIAEFDQIPNLFQSRQRHGRSSV
jgi:hypothetical protein